MPVEKHINPRRSIQHVLHVSGRGLTSIKTVAQAPHAFVEIACKQIDIFTSRR
jgi:hypothetical protein